MQALMCSCACFHLMDTSTCFQPAQCKTTFEFPNSLTNSVSLQIISKTGRLTKKCNLDKIASLKDIFLRMLVMFVILELQ